MRNITRVIIHSSATRPHIDVGAAEIRAWHTNPTSEGGRGWSDIGYHFVIRRSGAIEPGRPVYRPGAHTKGHNADSIGVCIVGGLSHDGEPAPCYTLRQVHSLRALIQTARHMLPGIEVIEGHRAYAATDCPSFSVPDFVTDACGSGPLDLTAIGRLMHATARA